MKDLIIVSAGDFARETAWLVSRINESRKQWNLLGFVDDNKAGKIVDGFPVLGTVDWLCNLDKKVYVTCAIGTGWVRERIWENLSKNPNLCPAVLIDPNAVIGSNCEIGAGSIICAGTVLTVAVKLGKNSIINLNCTLGHDTELADFCTVHPGVNISGRVHVGKCTDIGTGTKIIPGCAVAQNVVLGAGAVVIENIVEPGTYAGVPARRLQ